MATLDELQKALDNSDEPRSKTVNPWLDIVAARAVSDAACKRADEIRREAVDIESEYGHLVPLDNLWRALDAVLESVGTDAVEDIRNGLSDAESEWSWVIERVREVEDEEEDALYGSFQDQVRGDYMAAIGVR